MIATVASLVGRSPRMLLGGISAFLTSAVLAAPVTVLTCSGWVPFYDTWAHPRALENPSMPQRVAATLNTDHLRLTIALPHTGNIIIPITSGESHYHGELRFTGASIGTTPLHGVDVSLHRKTGEAFLFYSRASGRQQLIAFKGTCAPAASKS